jgi:hypothetical protein
MLASTTPFKIVNDENQNSVFKTTKGGRGGGLQQTAGKGGLSVFNESTNKIPIGSAMKSTRKPLVDVTNSTVHNNQTALRGGKTQSTENSAAVNKPIMVQFKVSEKPKSSDVKQATITSVALNGTDRKDMVRDVTVNLVFLLIWKLISRLLSIFTLFLVYVVM